ncbi:FxLYD domain-containing protein [Frankia sp. Ag45/Mut15]|uniref:FxLYD domain-containing protein n=1 Tax=Frankia umida TaxID=573489 RepID=A0ABT0K3B9_9ACTN|nr:FxLYD domain-containing protein [Frankia umida]MCK9878254.1 FxLYD domain-containing protein [Frankia umida]
MAATVMALAAACAGGNSASPGSTAPGRQIEADGGLVTGASGFGISRSPGTGMPDYVWATTMVTNRSDQITGLTASFGLYDRAGRVIGQSDTSAPILRAGAQIPVGTIVEVPAGSDVDKIVATVSPLVNLSEKDQHPESVFTTQGVHLQADPTSGAAQVLGEVVSHYQQPVKQVYVSVICYDQANRIIGGGEHYVDAINPGQQVAFSSDSLTVTGAPTRCDAYATLSGASAS